MKYDRYFFPGDGPLELTFGDITVESRELLCQVAVTRVRLICINFFEFWDSWEL